MCDLLATGRRAQSWGSNVDSVMRFPVKMFSAANGVTSAETAQCQVSLYERPSSGQTKMFGFSARKNFRMNKHREVKLETLLEIFSYRIKKERHTEKEDVQRIGVNSCIKCVSIRKSKVIKGDLASARLS